MSNDKNFGLSRIKQICVTVHDLERSIEFYRDTLGMNFLFRAPPHMAFFDCGGVRLMLGIPEKAEFDHPASIIYYEVENIGAAFETLKGRGVDFEEEPTLVHKAEDHDFWLAFFRDLDGNLLALASEVPRQ